MMMLRAHDVRPIRLTAGKRNSCGLIIRVQVACDHAGAKLVELLKIRQALLIVRQRARVLQIADVRREYRLPAPQQAEGVLELAAHGQHRRSVLKAGRQCQRGGSESPPAAHDARACSRQPDDRVIDTPRDLPVVIQKVLRHVSEPLVRLFVVDNLRLLREIPAGEHDRPVHAPQQQVMQRRVGQHETERPNTRSHRFCDGRTVKAVSALEQYDGCFRA